MANIFKKIYREVLLDAIMLISKPQLLPWWLWRINSERDSIFYKTVITRSRIGKGGSVDSFKNDSYNSGPSIIKNF